VEESPGGCQDPQRVVVPLKKEIHHNSFENTIVLMFTLTFMPFILEMWDFPVGNFGIVILVHTGRSKCYLQVQLSFKKIRLVHICLPSLFVMLRISSASLAQTLFMLTFLIKVNLTVPKLKCLCYLA
jgi:hypothetical protein